MKTRFDIGLLTTILLIAPISTHSDTTRLKSKIYYMTRTVGKIERSNMFIAERFPIGIAGDSYNKRFNGELYHVYPYSPLEKDSETEKLIVRDYDLSLKVLIPTKRGVPLELKTFVGDTLYLKKDGRISWDKIGRTYVNKNKLMLRKRYR